MAKACLQTYEYGSTEYLQEALDAALQLISDCESGGGKYNTYMYPTYSEVFEESNNWENKEALWKHRWYAGTKPAILETRHNRIPVYEENIDNIIGVLHVKDMMIEMRKHPLKKGDVRQMLRQPFFIPETKEADELFRIMQETRHHMALLVDEYGGFSGIVTIENLVEEIMGDINEEYEEVVPEIECVREDEYKIDGGVLIDDLNDELGLKLETENYDTLSGYLIEKLGHIPAKEDRDIIETDGLIFKIEEVKDNRITQVRLRMKDLK